jgi:hypothetical protein
VVLAASVDLPLLAMAAPPPPGGGTMGGGTAELQKGP